MFILVLMLRHCITKLREFGVIMILPLDEHIKFHKVTGRLMFIYSLVHSLAHLGNIGEWRDSELDFRIESCLGWFARSCFHCPSFLPEEKTSVALLREGRVGSDWQNCDGTCEL